MIMLSANNYLNLTNHPKVVGAMVEATLKWGAGSGSVRAIAGTMDIHLAAEEKVAFQAILIARKALCLFNANSQQPP